MQSWLLLAYKIPRDPTAARVYIWRKLKRLGALRLHDAVWILPQTAQTREQLQWLAAEVQELGGEVSVWESRSITAEQERALIEQFRAQAETAYREILDELKRKRASLAALSRRYQQIQTCDYFHCDLGKHVREALIAAGGKRKS